MQPISESLFLLCIQKVFDSGILRDVDNEEATNYCIIFGELFLW